MLTQRYTPEQIAAWLLPRNAWRPYPAADERAAWDGLPADQRAAMIARGEQALAAAWPALPATLFLDFARTGTRKQYETVHFTRRGLLRDLALAECAEGQGRFTDALADAVWSTLEESYWGVPAHVGMQRAGSGLPDTAEPTVDLFAGETAALLAWIHYLLGGALDGVSPLIRPRIAREIDTRMLTSCLERDDYWWMGLHGGGVNNWNPWINSNWLACALLLEADPARKQAAVAKILRSVDVFIDQYPEDGGCDEGPSYWGRAGASLYDCLELLHSATDGAIDVFGEEKIRNIGRFIYRAHIADRWVINFADAPARTTPSGALIYRYGRAIGDAEMQSFGAWLTGMSGPGVDNLPRQLPALFAQGDLDQTPAAPPLPRDVWLPETQIVVARTRGGSTDGLFFAAKGGHNAESHNHNDVGHFLVYAEGRPVLIDAGVETYSRTTFSSERYSLWTMQSQYHNLPTINGVMQQHGRTFAARALDYAADDAGARFSLDLAGAYPPEAGLTSWRRTFTVARAGAVTVEDAWRLPAAPQSLTVNLITPCAVTVGDGVITLSERALAAGLSSGRAVIRFPAGQWQAACETIAVTDPQLQATWGETLYRLVFTAESPDAEGICRMHVELA